MKRIGWGFLCLTLLVVAGCGSGSSISEQEAEDLLRHKLGLYAPECVKSSDGADRDFDCSASSKGDPVTLEITVGESGDTVVVTDCEDEGPIYGTEPCEGVH
jgi:hypothetical protein